jgi:chromosome segregation ATPase
LKDKIISYENENNSLDADLTATLDDIAALESRINENLAEIKKYQAAIAEAEALANRYKSETLHYQKCTQAEALKNSETDKLIAQYEHTLRLRTHQV